LRRQNVQRQGRIEELEQLRDEMLKVCKKLVKVREIDRGREAGELHLTSAALRGLWENETQKAETVIAKAERDIESYE